MSRFAAPDYRNWLLAGVALAAAAGAGFGASQLMAPRPAAPIAQEPKRAEAGEEGRVAMTAARIQAAGLQIVPAEGGALAGEIAVPGDVAAQPNGEAVLAARASGVVTRLNRRLGDAVRAGEVVALIESRDASSIAAERATAAARLTAAQRTYEREHRLYEAKISPRQDLDAAEAALASARAEAQRSAAAAGAARVTSDGRSVGVVSPIAGRITTAPAVLGSYVTAGAELFRVSDPNRIEIRAAVPALDASRISPGDAATVEAAGGMVAATVRSITPGVDTESRAATVVLNIEASASSLAPGQAVRLRIRPKAGAVTTGRVVVPEEAVQSVEGRDVVFIRTAQGFQAAPVTVTGRGGGRVEIGEGLAPGQMIAARGAFVLKAELGKGGAEHGH